ncbi:MAG: CPXCG motif-containing cysteine-rich protein [Proteobacteria bacterium]|nr:CPXCG motif-containing cysteine-rich protein [Pseudomonadota bacterium]
MIRRRTTPELARLRQRITQLDSASIDRLYGLEPVWEPGAGGLAPEEFVGVRCPYCGERLETRVDLTADEPSYMEDCEVCCRPIEFNVERDAGGALVALRVQRID